jgi:hypothetical protein
MLIDLAWIEESRRLVPHQNATTMQVAISERGPQSPGGITETQVPHSEADFLRAEVLSKAWANRRDGRACRDPT